MFYPHRAGFIDPAPVGAPVTPAATSMGKQSAAAGRKGLVQLRTLLVLGDFAATAVAWTTVLAVADHEVWHLRLGKELVLSLALSCFTLMVMAMHKLYLARVCSVRAYEVSRLARSSALCALAAFALKRLMDLGSSPTIALLGAACAFVALTLVRGGYSGWLRKRRADGVFCRAVCLLGVNDEAEALVELFDGQPELGYRIVAAIGDPLEWAARSTGIPALEAGDDLAATVSAMGASGVIVAMSAVEPKEINRTVNRLSAAGLHVQISTGLSRVGRHRMRMSPLSHQLLFYVERPTLSYGQELCKRAIDVVLAGMALLVAAPVLLAAAVAIKIDDRGPIIYSQERVGRGGGTFHVFKMRTMVPNAASLVETLRALNERNGPLFKLSHDPRVTRVGRILRATSIDELPQLWNVLRGEMSLVGPRPALPKEVAQFDDELLERSAVKPGITGLWQVEASDKASFNAYRRLDLFYVDNWSVVMDFTIMAGTVGVVLRRAMRGLRRKQQEASAPLRVEPGHARAEDVKSPELAAAQAS